MTNIQQLRQDIESTRGDLTSDVAMLTEKVNPQQIARRRVNKVRGVWDNVRGKVMGSAHEAGEVGRETASSAAHQVTSAGHQISSAASSVGEKAGAARQMPRQQVQGSPLAAGLVAFGVGVLVSSMLPPSQRERQLAGRVKDEASEQAGHLRQQAMQAAQHVTQDMRQPVRNAAMESARSAARAASEMMNEGRATARDVRSETRDAARRG